MVRALTEPWGRPGELVRSSVHLLKLDQGIATCMARAAAAWPLRLSAQDLFGSNGLATLAANDLLCAILHRRSATSRWSVFLPWPGVPCLKPPQG